MSNLNSFEQLSEDQESALNQIRLTEWPVLITGGAGTGKSLLLKRYVNDERRNGPVAVAAPTGIAALNVEGLTLHSLFGLGISGIMNQNSFRRKNSLYFQDLRCLVIDEVSMVRVDVMNTIDHALRFHRDSDEPFGGLKLVLFGDPYQLPPVITGTDLWDDKFKGRILEKIPFFFNAMGFRDRPIRILSLKTVHRQSDDLEFTEILNKIRISSQTEENLAFLAENSQKGVPDNDIVRLFGKNDAVEEWNNTQLENLYGPEPTIYRANWIKNEGLIESLKKYSLSIPQSERPRLAKIVQEHLDQVNDVQDQVRRDLNPWERELRLKEGARVIFTKNDPDRKWVNGTTGTILSLGDQSISVTLDSADGIEQGPVVSVFPARFEKTGIVWAIGTSGKPKLSVEIVGWFEQLPIRLGWAITVHKSQGQTLDRAVLEFGDQYFEKGQAYVALSRVRSMRGLHFTSNPTASDILSVDQRVFRFMKEAESFPYGDWVHPEVKKTEQIEKILIHAEDLGFSKEVALKLLEDFVSGSGLYDSLDDLVKFINQGIDPKKLLRIALEDAQRKSAR